MINLQADNRSLTKNVAYTYTTKNLQSGVNSFYVSNASNIPDITNKVLLIGEWGAEDAEIVTISSVIDNLVTLLDTTTFSHTESTKVYVLPYDSVQFYYWTDTTFANAVVLGAPVAINPKSVYTTYVDTTNTLGYAWYKFVDTSDIVFVYSVESNPIPYTDFPANSAKKILDSFFSNLKNKELKLITLEDAFSWLSEAYSITVNRLNMINPTNKLISLSRFITIIPGTAEYILPVDCSKIEKILISDSQDQIYPMSLGDQNVTGRIKYYQRANYIGFNPIPSNGLQFDIVYKQKPPALYSYYDLIELPNNNFYVLNYYMMWKAGPKLERGDYDKYYQYFNDGINDMKINATKEDDTNLSWGINRNASV